MFPFKNDGLKFLPILNAAQEDPLIEFKNKKLLTLECFGIHGQTVRRKCEVLDLAIPRSFMLKFDANVEDPIKNPNFFWICN
jgi:hypothetical protein